ncbi:MAG: hypothetical protein LBI86_09400 [Treponema sp.]|nr:hypothetical protein [Treponema sp.]
MKNKIAFLLLAFSLALFVASCATQPAPTPAPQPVQEAPPPPPPPPRSEPEPTLETVYEQHATDLILEGAKPYAVVRTDTLSRITRANYGASNGYFFPIIMLASRETVTDPDLIKPGMDLTIPDLQRNLDDPGARQRIKEFLNEIADVYNRKGRAETRDRLRALASSL